MQCDDSLSAQSQYNITIIPVEYPRNRNCGTKTNHMVEQYNRGNNDDLSSSQGALYSVSQRVPNISSSYSSLCGGATTTTDDIPEWDSRQRTTTDMKDNNSDVMSDKQNYSNATTASAKNSIASGSSTASNSAVGETTTGPINQAGVPQGPIIPTCVFLHSRTAIMMEIEDTPSANCELLCQAIANSDEVGLNKQVALQVFTLWAKSHLLELQLKPTHKPYDIRQSWRSLIGLYSHASPNRQQRDEPKLMYQRNVFFPQHSEEKIKDQKILELLYEEARHNILEGRYPCEVSHYIMLGGIQARVELGPYNQQVHSTHYFREEQRKYLPVHVRKSSTWTWFPVSSKNSAEVRLLEQFKRIPTSATNRKLMRKYLEFCWSLPFYGSAFFEGQIEQPVRGLTSLMTHQDIPVLVGINSKGVYIIDDTQCSLLLGLRFEELSWEYARPSKENDPNCLPCLFVQFMVVENGARVSKILQVFSRQAGLMDTLITVFVNQIKTSKVSVDETDKNYVVEPSPQDAAVVLSGNHSNLHSLSNKLSKLTLATFDEDGHCIGQMGSWSFSY